MIKYSWYRGYSKLKQIMCWSDPKELSLSQGRTREGLLRIVSGLRESRGSITLGRICIIYIQLFSLHPSTLPYLVENFQHLLKLLNQVGKRSFINEYSTKITTNLNPGRYLFFTIPSIHKFMLNVNFLNLLRENLVNLGEILLQNLGRNIATIAGQNSK